MKEQSVKDLEWQPAGNGAIAATPFGYYDVYWFEGDACFEFGGDAVSVDGDIDVAKTAAQSDYQRRYNECTDPQ